MISGTNGIAGCADGLLMFTRNNNQAKQTVRKLRKSLSKGRECGIIRI